MSETVGMFCRVSPNTYALLKEQVRALDASRKPGDARVPLGLVVERCVVQVLQPDVEPDPRTPRPRKKAGRK